VSSPDRTLLMGFLTRCNSLAVSLDNDSALKILNSMKTMAVDDRRIPLYFLRPGRPEVTEISAVCDSRSMKITGEISNWILPKTRKIEIVVYSNNNACCEMSIPISGDYTFSQKILIERQYAIGDIVGTLFLVDDQGKRWEVGQIAVTSVRHK
jgi:hypothetical protein